MAAPLRSDGYEAFGGIRLSAPWSQTTGASLRLGGQLGDHGAGLRDGNLMMNHLLVNRPDMLLRVRGGTSLPLGELGTDLAVTPGASRSFDPMLGANLVTGGTWLGVFSVTSRIPVYEGADAVRQGAFARLDTRAARRVSGWSVPWVGLSTSAIAADSAGSNNLVELAAAAGATFNVAEQWALSLQTRVPVASTSWPTPYAFAGGLNISYVVAGKDEEEHHDGDGHDH